MQTSLHDANQFALVTIAHMWKQVANI